MFFKIKMLIFVLAIASVTTLAFGQLKGIVNYKLTMVDSKSGRSRVEHKVLYLNGSASIQVDSKMNDVKNRQIDEMNDVRVIVLNKPTFILKDLANDKLLLSDIIGTKKNIIKDTLNNFKWFITKDLKRIQNYNCRKATLNFRGRNYEAWYTEEIPLQNGPWKFCGLPGLIIRVADVENKFVYEVTGINLKAKYDNKIISVPKEYMKDKTITHKEFMILYKKRLEDYVKLSKVVETSADGTSSSVSIYLPEKMEKF